MEYFESDLKEKDEFAYFKEAVYAVRRNNEQVLSELVNKLPNNKRDYLRDILNSQRIIVDAQGEKTEARKIVKAKARKVATNINMNNQ